MGKRDAVFLKVNSPLFRSQRSEARATELQNPSRQRPEVRNQRSVVPDLRKVRKLEGERAR